MRQPLRTPHWPSRGEIAKVSRYLSGTTTGITFSGRSFSVQWEFGPYDGRKVDPWIGGASFDPPRYVIRTLRLSIGGSDIPIPQKAYFDIYDPDVYRSGPWILEDSQFVYLAIMASDGAGSAKVSLKFHAHEYVGRDIETHE